MVSLWCSPIQTMVWVKLLGMSVVSYVSCVDRRILAYSGQMLTRFYLLSASCGVNESVDWRPTTTVCKAVRRQPSDNELELTAVISKMCPPHGF